MKKYLKKGHSQFLKDLWRKLYSSKKEKMSEGAQELSKIITSAHKDNWRRNSTRSEQRHKKPN